MSLQSFRGRAALALLAGACVLGGAALAAMAGTPQSTRPLQAAYPERAMLMSVARAGDRLVAVGEHGVIALSDDNGNAWRNAAEVPVDATLTGVRFADARRGWAIGHLGVVLRTEDGGERWTTQLDAEAIGRLAQSAGEGAAADPGLDATLLDLLVDDAERATVIGAYGLALATDDGGRSWRSVSPRFDNPNRLHLYGLAKTSSGLVAVGEQGLVLHGQGETLKTVKPPYDGSFFGVQAAGDALVAYGLRGNAFVSRDGGASWSPSKLAGSGASINSGTRLADGRLLLADQAGGVFVSDNGGQRFERVPFAWGAPITGLTEAADGGVIVASLGGMARMPMPAGAGQAAKASNGAAR